MELYPLWKLSSFAAGGGPALLGHIFSESTLALNAASCIQDDMDDTPLPSRNDPTPERRTGDSSFLPVVIVSVVVILVLFVVFVFLIKGNKEKVIPGQTHPHPTSQIVRPEPANRAA